MDNHTSDMFYLNAFADSTRLKGLFFVLFLTIYLATVIGNILIMILTNIDYHLQTPMYFFLKHLSFLDICYTSITLPQILVNCLTEHVAISLPACIIQLFLFLSLAASESSLLAAMAYDRYVAICNPLRYSAIMSRDICTKMVVAAWIIGSIYGAIHTTNTFRLPFCGPRVLNHYFCDIPPLLKISCINTFINEVTVFAVGGFFMLGCFILIIASYMHIVFLVFTIPKGGGRMKTFSTCVSHLVIVILYYGSGSFMYMRPKSYLLADKEWLLSIFYTSITPLLNPIIYTLRNKDIRIAIYLFFMSRWNGVIPKNR